MPWVRLRGPLLQQLTVAHHFARSGSRRIPAYRSLQAPSHDDETFLSIPALSISHRRFCSPGYISNQQPRSSTPDCSGITHNPKLPPFAQVPILPKSAPPAQLNPFLKLLSSRMGLASCVMDQAGSLTIDVPPMPALPSRPLLEYSIPREIEIPPGPKMPWRPPWDRGLPSPNRIRRGIPLKISIFAVCVGQKVGIFRGEEVADALSQLENSSEFCQIKQFHYTQLHKAYEWVSTMSKVPGIHKVLYAVRAGRQTGVLFDWDELQSSIKGYPGAQYRAFFVHSDGAQRAKDWLDGSSEGYTLMSPWSLMPFAFDADTAPVSKVDDQDRPEVFSVPELQMLALRLRSTHVGITRKYPTGLKELLTRVALNEPLGRSYGKVNVWCDGSAKLKHGGTDGSGSKEDCGWGVFFPSSSGYSKCSEAGRLPDNAGNHASELVAIGRACEIVPPYVPIRIHTDSHTSLEALRDVAQAATQAAWTTEFCTALKWVYQLISRRPAAVELVYVKGHGDAFGNYAADLLAKRGTEESLNPNQMSLWKDLLLIDTEEESRIGDTK